MPRQPRQRSKTGIYHVMLRGINRQVIFEDENDRWKFYKTISNYKEVCNYRVYGYCFMDNHIHLLLKEEESLSMALKRICSSFVYWYNWKYERSGHLFQERYKSEAVETDEYFLTVIRYIHQNPVKGGLSKGVADYKWSSYQEYIGRPVITDIEFVLKLFSSNEQKAIERFVVFNKETNEDKCLDYDEGRRITDEEVKEMLLHHGINNVNHLLQLDRKERDKVISFLKSVEGVTVRQLSRITGISKSVIDRA